MKRGIEKLFACWRYTPVTWLLAGLALVLFTFPQLGAQFEVKFHTTEPTAWWTWLSCHLLHWSTEHLFWDLVMFVALGLVCERRFRWRFAAVLLLSAYGIPWVISQTHPLINTYRGLSGLDTALFTLWAVSSIVRGIQVRDIWPVLGYASLLALLVGKLSYELLTGEVLFVQDSSFLALPAAHLVGAAIGLCLSLVPGHPKSDRSSAVPVCWPAAQQS